MKRTYMYVIRDPVIIDNPGFTTVGGRINSAVTCAKMDLYVIISMELQVHESNLLPLDLKGYLPSC